MASWQISSARACSTSPSTWRAMMRGLRPPTLGTSIESSSGIIEVRAQPCFFLIFSASPTGVRSATATSFVKCSPPTCSTAVCQSEPFSKMARSVVPPPTSTIATPSSFSSGVRHASAAAIWVSTVSTTSSPARFTQVTVFWAAVVEQVMTWTFTSSRVPVMPGGVADPVLVVHHELLGQHVEDLAVEGDGDGLGGVDHPPHVLACRSRGSCSRPRSRPAS